MNKEPGLIDGKGMKPLPAETHISVYSLIIPHWKVLVVCLFCMVLGQAARLFIPFSAKYLIDTIVLKHEANRLPWLVAAALAATVIDGATFFFVGQLLTRTAEQLIADLRTRLQAHIVRLPLVYFDNNLSGSLVSKIMSDVEGVRDLVGPGMVSFCLALLTSVMTLVVLASRSWEVTLVVICVLTFAAFTSHRAFEFIRPLMAKGHTIRAEIAGRLTESMGGIRVIKGYCAEDRESEFFAAGVLRLFTNVMQSRIGFNVLGFAGAMSIGLSTALLMFLGGKRLLEGRWTAGDYVQYSAMMAYLIGPIFHLVSVSAQITQAVSGLDRIREVLAEEIEDSDSMRKTHLPALLGHVRVEDVSFAYEAGKSIVHDISFTAGPGTVTALVGSSGAGKSTLISLLCSFHRPSRGRLLVDGIDLTTVNLKSYRSQLGLVLQESFLFDGTVRENILFSSPNATSESFLEACRISRVDEFAEQLPQSYDTFVGERGVRLSGGQRQRISIARAILSDPKILIMDEATSSLDSESEAMIQEGLEYLMKGRTTFVIAHRLSTIRRADQILVLEGGRIVECGTHQSLQGERGRYYDLYTRQHNLS